MLKNYFIVAIRHLTRHKLFSAINILCLGVGIAFSMLIGNYIMQEKNVNLSLRHAENQYLIKSKWKVANMGIPITTLAPLAKALKENYPALVQNYYRFNPLTNVASAGEKHFKVNISICDTSLVTMYGMKLLHGNPHQAFPTNSSAVISRDFAMKLYGTTNAINKTVTVTGTSGKQDFLVSAVLETMPYNTVNQIVDKNGYDVFVPYEGVSLFGLPNYFDDWNNFYIVGMIELKAGVSPRDMAAPVNQLLARHLPGNLKGLLQVEFVNLNDYYLKDQNEGAAQQMITTLMLIAGFIILMAIINFVNISIGTSTYRLKEIGLRKVFGSARKQLIIQYLVESILLTFVATIISFCIYEGMRPFFNQLLNTQIEPVWQFSTAQAGWLLLFVTVLGLIAGLYPALALASANIIHAVKGKIDMARGGLILRKTLLIVQFTLAVFIFISALTVSKQVTYFFKKDLGYNKEQLLVITAFPKQWDSAGVLKMESIRDGLAQSRVVQSASMAFEVPDRLPPNTTDLLPQGGLQKPIVVPTIGADQYYASTFGLTIKEGGFLQNNNFNFSPSRESEIVLNESAVKALRLTAPVGALINTPNGFTFKVMGVVKDFNLTTFQQQIGPLAFIPTRLVRSYRYLTVKLNTTDVGTAITTLKKKWQEFSPGSPFEYTFMDDRFQSMFEEELKLKKATSLATGLNLFIVFMGLFGVVAFTLARRTREIAVRKVLGADVKNIIALFFRDYAPLIVIANIIAWPLAYMTTNHWLQHYAYRIQQDIFPYITVALVISVAIFAFISAQCYRTAVSNPVRNLRTD
jgi:putative ABC transport system permease protein